MTDLISRQAAISMIDDLMGGYIPIGTSTFKEGVADGYARAISRIKTLPSAEKHGKWIVKTDALGREYFVCVSCKTELMMIDEDGHLFRVRNAGTKYCPNCGAKMEVCDETN